MKIYFNKPILKRKYLEYLQKYFDNAVKVLEIPTTMLEVNVALIDKKQIKKMNCSFRGVDKVTDVLSFPNLLATTKSDTIIIDKVLTLDNFSTEVNPETNMIMLGDIYICLSKVKEQAKEYCHSEKREFCYLAVHGLLHLLGYDHMNDSEKEVMRKKEEIILDGLE